MATLAGVRRWACLAAIPETGGEGQPTTPLHAARTVDRVIAARCHRAAVRCRITSLQLPLGQLSLGTRGGEPYHLKRGPHISTATPAIPEEGQVVDA